MVVMVLFFQQMQSFFDSILIFHGIQNLLSGQLFPVSCNDGCMGIMFTEKFHSLRQLGLIHACSVAQNNGACMFHLIVEEFTKVLHVNLCFLGIYYGGKSVQLNLIQLQIFYSSNNIGQLAYAGWFNQNSFRLELFDNLFQCLAKIPHQAAADASGVHFVDFHTGILQETAVDSDFTKFIFDEHQLFALVCFFDQLLN